MGAVTILALVVAASAAASNPPVKQQAEQASAPKHEPESDYRGTEKAPFVVRVQAVPPPTEEERREKAEERHDKADSDWWLVKLTAALAVATIALVFATGLLWRSTKKLVTEAEDTAKRQLRAYVSTDTEVVTIDGALPKVPTHGIILRNHGQTPANQITHWTRLLVAEFPLKEPLDRSEPVDVVIKSVLHPGADRHIVAEKDLTDDEFGAIMKDGYALYFWGDVKYIDVFNNPQSTRFTYFLDRGAFKIGKWAHYKDGNDST